MWAQAREVARRLGHTDGMKFHSLTIAKRAASIHRQVWIVGCGQWGELLVIVRLSGIVGCLIRPNWPNWRVLLIICPLGRILRIWLLFIVHTRRFVYPFTAILLNTIK